MAIDPESGAAVVVDSDIPATPLDSVPVESDYSVSVPDTETTSTGEGAEPVTAAPPVDSWKETMKSQYGFDVSGYSTENDARQAIRDITERFALVGVQQQQYAPTPVEPEIAKVDDDAEEEVDDSPAAKKLRSQLKKLKAENERVAQEYRAAQDAQEQAVKQEILNRAVAAIDKLSHPKYGVGQTRDFLQMRNARNLIDLANSIYMGMASTPGTQIPTIEVLIEMAADYEAKVEGRQKPSVQQPVAPKGQENSNLTKKFEAAMDKRNPVQEVRKAQTDPTYRKEVTRNTVESFKKDPKFMQAMREISSRK